VKFSSMGFEDPGDGFLGNEDTRLGRCGHQAEPGDVASSPTPSPGPDAYPASLVLMSNNTCSPSILSTFMCAV
jgi:hypothetical protein